MAGTPPILAFSSVADATVSTRAVVDTLFARLAPQGHRLVLFDVNRQVDAAALFTRSAAAVDRTLTAGPELQFELTIVGNANARSFDVVERTRKAGTRELVEQPLAIAWPRNVFSLSHVALPFPPDDPVYGRERPTAAQPLFIGRLDVQGERGVLTVPPAALLRLRHNPFVEPMAADIDRFVARR